jgi:hypothetical protein
MLDADVGSSLVGFFLAFKAVLLGFTYLMRLFPFIDEGATEATWGTAVLSSALFEG